MISPHTLQSQDGLNFTEHILTADFGNGKTIEMRTGKLAKQAAGTILARVGDTTVLVSCVVADVADDKKDFFPLMVDYREKFYAGGRIPGGFFKREGKPHDDETLRARVIDRTLRPMFAEGFRNEVQVYVTVLSYDKKNPAELVALCAAGAALHISKAPFLKPIAGVRMGRVDGQLVVNPTHEESLSSDLDLIVAGHADGINMVECGAKEVSEDTLVEALDLAHKQIRALVSAMDALRAKCGKPKMAFEPPAKNKDLIADVEKLVGPHLKEIESTYEKNAREERLKKATEEITAALIEKYPEQEKAIAGAVHDADERNMRRRVIKQGIRADGRKPTEIRPIWAEVDVLPVVHGSSIFTRGQTQALSCVTLGSVDDQQMIDDMGGVSYKDFMLHYNFPSFSVGECRPPRGPGRREIGHGMLAERAIAQVLPTKEEWPYTMRAVVEILESNGSSSMATICSTSMALMDAGCPLKGAVAGIAMGLITDDQGGVEILTDIQGVEDHLGDMDFKVAGTHKGVTALQMDIKVEGVTRSVLERALSQARDAREFILKKMEEAISGHREEMKPHVPRITVIKIPTEKIREVIGSGGKVVQRIVELSGAKVDIEDDGSIFVMAADQNSAKMALDMINTIVKEIEIDAVYTGKVTRIIEHGAIVELSPGKDGMIHISELEHRRVATVDEVLSEGDIVTVKVLEVDKDRGRVRLSRKALIPKPEGHTDDHGGDREHRGERRGGGDRGDRGGFRDRGDRGGDRGRDREHRGGDREHRGEREHRSERPEREAQPEHREHTEHRSESAPEGGSRERRPRPPRN